MWFSLSHKDFRKWDDRKKVEYIITKNRKRAVMFELLIKFCSICLTKKIRMIFENPWSENTYLKQNVFLKKPTLIDQNRTRRGDRFVKPTAYWFTGCTPTNGETLQPTPKNKMGHIGMTSAWRNGYTDAAKGSSKTGLCSEERSMISPDYARNFICDFILGKKQDIGQLSLF